MKKKIFAIGIVAVVIGFIAVVTLKGDPKKSGYSDNSNKEKNRNK